MLISNKEKEMKISNKLYDILSKIQRWLPVLGVAYLGICKIWGCPLGTEVNETLMVLATLLASTLEISSAAYFKKNDK